MTPATRVRLSDWWGRMCSRYELDGLLIGFVFIAIVAVGTYLGCRWGRP